MDLAMMHLFGGFGPKVFAAYDEAFPMADGAGRTHRALPAVPVAGPRAVVRRRLHVSRDERGPPLREGKLVWRSRRPPGCRFEHRSYDLERLEEPARSASAGSASRFACSTARIVASTIASAARRGASALRSWPRRAAKSSAKPPFGLVQQPVQARGELGMGSHPATVADHQRIDEAPRRQARRATAITAS